ncbi:MAG: hypothetical protein AAF921_10570 [Cyanobacteria bacterium P01_D01_bin.44]
MELQYFIQDDFLLEQQILTDGFMFNNLDRYQVEQLQLHMSEQNLPTVI